MEKSPPKDSTKVLSSPLYHWKKFLKNICKVHCSLRASIEEKKLLLKLISYSYSIQSILRLHDPSTSATSIGMTFTKDLSSLDIKTLALHVFFAELNMQNIFNCLIVHTHVFLDFKLCQVCIANWNVTTYLLSHRAVKTLWVVVAVESLHPAVPSLNGKPASNALGREQLVPI